MGRTLAIVHTYRGEFHTGPHRPGCRKCKLPGRAGVRIHYEGRIRRAVVLRAERERRRLSLNKMSILVGTDVDRYARWERRDSDMTEPTQRRVEKCLGLALGELM